MGMVRFVRGTLPLATAEADGSSTLLELANSERLDLVPFVCAAGTCGTCLIRLVEGDLAQPLPLTPGIDEWTLERDGRLSCQCVPEAGAALVIDTIPPI